MEKTLVIIKPDGVERGLVGEIISRYEKKGLKIGAAKLLIADEEILSRHYQEHKGKDYYNKLINYMTEGPIMAMVLEGENVIKIVRNMNGHKDPSIARPGTIRGDFSYSLTRNIVHASDSEDSSKREIKIWFPEYE
ncbi:nucleoside-diphosphate kinase [Caldisalinibacter kiritimatiensis]|uniref:Nucleoside diphosphate kinase n=1 Tax=Caldisalinibacter kiritimatiensis TaxID=1304284 RepID=R1CYB3_9FIRM|nr:nucleoside-diphosphate kinase [Caldisalinibacter kiritimatiensis]EOD01564.1 Nucleoside diphosphate kinase [Caldisalinibacter kiritimatiensis]